MQRWTEDEKEYIRQHYTRMADSEIAEQLARSIQSVTKKRIRMGLGKYGTRIDAPYYSKREEEYIRTHWQDMTDEEIANNLARSERGVRYKRRRMGIDKSDWSPLSPEEVIKRRILKGYKRSAQKFDRDWHLTRKDFDNLISKNCHYCGTPPTRTRTHHNGIDSIDYNGIDRVDSEKGYAPGNTVACCWRCNIAKHDMSVAEFSGWVERVYDHFVIGKTVS